MQQQSGKRVLLVDDSPAILAILRRVIQEASGSAAPAVRSVTSATEALDMMQAFDPHLIITDWHMPEVSGIELLQTLRQTGFNKVQVGFVTAETTPERVNEARVNGAAFVVHKPFDDVQLIQYVRDALGAPPVPVPAPAARPAPAAQPAPPAAAPAQADGPVACDAMERLLKVALKKAAFTLTPCAPLRSESITPFVLCGHYAHRDDKPKVAGLLDFGALCILGVGTGVPALDVAAVTTAVQRGRPDPEVVQRAATFLRVACRLMQGHTDAEPWKLLRAQVVSRAAGDLDTLLAAAAGRTDMQLAVAGCADAHMTFIHLA